MGKGLQGSAAGEDGGYHCVVHDRRQDDPRGLYTLHSCVKEPFHRVPYADYKGTTGNVKAVK